MGDLILVAVLAACACKAFTGRWPWAGLGGRRNAGMAARVAKARALLGVDASAEHATIIDAHRRLIMAVHPDRGGSAALVHEANDARDTLLADLAQRISAQTGPQR